MKSRLSKGTDQVQLYTMRDLNQDTAGTIEKINKSGKPAIITRHGRFIAVIYPLVGTAIESRLVARAIQDLETQDQLIEESAVQQLYTAQEAADEFLVDADIDNADRELDGPHWE
ncbi:hypothetical protein [Mycolicibacterium septicum]|uniref:hypothetical protein n=1 Tax=Mycolicibacterium septicum TaxID=98668 RepID=UPI00235F5004|nr:hypothetical protein [Mycolicibacterium septicum]